MQYSHSSVSFMSFFQMYTEEQAIHDERLINDNLIKVPMHEMKT